ncbi:MAG: MFS transporter [Acetobacteraceae bacterium]|nr:MFS transporter [Acetobacteraceae bacterium]
MRSWCILAALALGRIAFGYQFQTVATLAPDLVPRFQLSYAALGTLIGAYMLLGIFVALPLGLLGRRFGDRLVLGCGMALMVGGALVSAFGTGPDGIAAGRTAAGVGAVAMIVLQGKVIADWFEGRQFMLAISISVCSYPVGVGLAQLVLPPLADAHGWRAGFLSGGLLAAIAMVLFVGTYRTPPHVRPVPRRFALPSARECLLLGIAGLCWTFYTSGWAAFASYLPATMAARGEGLALTALAMTIVTWGNVPGTLFGGGLVARVGGFRIFLVGTGALVIGMAGSAVLDWPVTWALLLGSLGALHPGVIMAVGTLSARSENRAVGMAVFYSLYYLGGTLGPAACGRVADLYGGPAGGLLGAAAISALALPAYLLHRRLAHHETMLVRA